MVGITVCDPEHGILSFVIDPKRRNDPSFFNESYAVDISLFLNRSSCSAAVLLLLILLLFVVDAAFLFPFASIESKIRSNCSRDGRSHVACALIVIAVLILLDIVVGNEE
jgi:hypothetical protein